MSTRYRTITVGELMGVLSEFEPELPVFIQSGNAFAGIKVDEDTESFKYLGGNSRLFIAEMKARDFIVSNILCVLRRSVVYY